jgi:DnaJ-class molecular chaperone
MEGEGDEEVDADAPGDLCFKLQPKAGLFTCDGSAYDLQASASLTLFESLLGFHRVLLVGLDGTPIRVKRDARHEDVVVVRGQGLYKRDKRSRGDLAIRLKVEDTVQDWVQGLDADQRAVLEGLMPPKRVDLFEGRTDVIEA